jgi:hypothetical protein
MLLGEGGVQPILFVHELHRHGRLSRTQCCLACLQGQAYRAKAATLPLLPGLTTRLQ